MLKTLEFGEKRVQFSTSFAWMFIYKSQFKEDPAESLIPAMQEAFMMKQPESTGDAERDAAMEEEFSQRQAMMLFKELGFVRIAGMAWAMAKACDRSIPEPQAWANGFGDDFAVLDIVLELVTEAMQSCFATKKSMAPVPKEDAEPKRARTRK